MSRVQCVVEEVMLESDSGREVEGVRVTCGKCSHSTQSFGTAEASIKRCLALLREECPENERNFYVTD